MSGWRIIRGMMAGAVYELSSQDACDFVAKRRGLSEHCNDSRPALDQWLKSEPNAPECAKFILDLLVIARRNGGGYHENKWDKDFLALCELAGGTPEKLAELEDKKQEQGGFWDPKMGDDGKPKKGLAAKLEKAKAKLPVLSPAARAKIAAAAKARWAKLKAKAV